MNVYAEDWAKHKPACEAGADLIMDYLSKMPQGCLVSETGLSASLAAKMRKMIYEFPNKLLGYKAVEAYTGVVFKALQYDTLDAECRERCDSEVKIISSLYGWLRADDIIKPYRLDFTSKAALGGKALNVFWRKDVTIQLVKALKENGEREVLNLLPGDAAKCIDWKIVKSFCKVWKIDFVEMKDGGEMKTPTATKLKMMRGLLLRQILTEGINDIEGLRRVKSDDYVCEGISDYPDRLRFLC